jgi:hypothetical protein
VIASASASDRLPLEAFGFTPRESGFLALAALHSGFFATRHYADWSDRPLRGSSCHRLVKRLVSKRFARPFRLRGGNGYLYHLHAPNLYAALGDPHNQNQRRHPVRQVMARIQILDFVLAHRDYEFFPTVREKLQLADECHIPRDRVPVRVFQSWREHPNVRYFAEKLPVFRKPGSPAVWVAFVAISRHRGPFRTFLRRYLPFLEAFPQSGIVVIQRHAADAVSRQLFNEVVREPVLRHFRDRAAWERADYAAFPTKRVWQLRQDEARYAGEKYQAMYRRWQIEGDAAAAAPALPALEIYELPHDYAQFGPWAR